VTERARQGTGIKPCVVIGVVILALLYVGLFAARPADVESRVMGASGEMRDVLVPHNEYVEMLRELVHPSDPSKPRYSSLEPALAEAEKKERNARLLRAASLSGAGVLLVAALLILHRTKDERRRARVDREAERQAAQRINRRISQEEGEKWQGDAWLPQKGSQSAEE
jgi:hypothetical protein